MGRRGLGGERYLSSPCVGREMEVVDWTSMEKGGELVLGLGAWRASLVWNGRWDKGR